jgi:glycine cleavage system H protein
VNTALPDHPELVNDAPYDKGWMLLIQPEDAKELDALMDANAYEAFVGTLAH